MTSEIIPISVAEELQKSYLAYSVAIFNRALPSVVDGLKSAQRRIILGIKDLNLKPDGQYKKVSRLEGHVLGSYHPQGGCAGTAINMGQAEGFRYLLTDIHGNVGGSLQSGPSVGQSISEDPPAAARYLEVKSSALTHQLFINEIDKHSCAWRDNYDGSTQEVVEIVPGLPSLLINGAQGIAAGYACHHVSYNLSEVIKGVVEYIKNPSITTKRLFSIIKGPDLPNGARILNTEDIYSAFDTGSGTIKVYGQWEVKDIKYGKRTTRKSITITSLASGSSERFLEKLRSGVESEKITGVADAQDLSSTAGIEIQVVLKSGVEPDGVISQLLAFTNLYDTIGVNATAICGGLPRSFGVKEIIEKWHGARCEALKSRYEAECEKISARIHVLEGLLKVLLDIDKVVKAIRNSPTKEIATQKLMSGWGLSEIQAGAVLSMPLSRLVNTEKLELDTEKATLQARKDLLNGIINDKTKMDEHIIAQVGEFKQFADKRRSVLVNSSEIKVEKAKVVRTSTLRRAKIISPVVKIKQEGRGLGMKRKDVNEFFRSVAGSTQIKQEWEDFKTKWSNAQQLTTRKGKKERREVLEGLKAAAIARGLDKRGQRGWNAFMDSMTNAEKATINEIEVGLDAWMAEKY